jgi:hypothetical protein
MAYTIYLAGELFDHKHLAGNWLLARAIAHYSDRRFQCLMPQDLEQTSQRTTDIRNQDLRAVLASDLILLHFDGNDIDSGTVAEFMFAKLLDIPAVILRTDFRLAGDQMGGDPWNLMCSGYPRTESLSLNALGLYRAAQAQAGAGGEHLLEPYYEQLALLVIAALERVLQQPALTTDPAQLSFLYHWACQFPGAEMPRILSEPEWQAILASKLQRGLYAA